MHTKNPSNKTFGQQRIIHKEMQNWMNETRTYQKSNVMLNETETKMMTFQVLMVAGMKII
jgi:hypothetical protein